MDDKPPFDPVKASFYLIAAILVFQCCVVLLTLVWCMYTLDPARMPDFKCDRDGNFNQLLTGALAAALAFAGGFTRKDK
jgi:hypothetical protein